MKKLTILILILIGVSAGVSAQVLDPVLGPTAWKKENVRQKDAITLTHIREADVMWSKRIWRTLDLRQKMNLVLYYPMDSATLGKRSFVQLIYDEFVLNPENVGPDAVKMYADYELRTPLTRDEIFNMLSRKDTVQLLDPENCVTYDSLVQNDFQEVKPNIIKVHLMEDWFFDKQRSVLDVRILALGLELPIYQPGQDLDEYCGLYKYSGYQKVDIGDGNAPIIWFFFPAMRSTLAAHECFKRHNDAARVSYDDIFLSRMFGSYIVKEENVYDRYIKDYTAGLDALLEAEKISNEIEEFEQVLWEY
jgi:gliding motility associated protien GldN